jgi:hypothetical protein
LLGLGGSGRYTIVKLVAFMQGFQIMALDGAKGKDGGRDELK